MLGMGRQDKTSKPSFRGWQPQRIRLSAPRSFRGQILNLLDTGMLSEIEDRLFSLAQAPTSLLNLVPLWMHEPSKIEDRGIITDSGTIPTTSCSMTSSATGYR